MATTTQDERKIIHVDADSFYASVEMREDPELTGKPVAVGGRTGRGVIATSNYEARKYGVRSAMPSSRALALCPNLIILKPRFELYREVSEQLRDIFRSYTSSIEPLSLDEAYLDVTGSGFHNGSGTLIANEIRQRAKEELRITVSAGVAPNKFLAKVASDWNKPDGTFTIAPNEVAHFVLTLPVGKIMGVGKVTEKKLQDLGVATCGDLQHVPLELLVKRFGKYGRRLSELALGIDNRAVNTSRIRKSISVERTYADDLEDADGVLAQLHYLLEELSQRFAKIEDRYQPHKRFVKVKFQDFRQTTLEEIIPADGQRWRNEDVFGRLLVTAWSRHSLPARLLGVGLRLEPNSDSKEPQLGLFGPQKCDE